MQEHFKKAEEWWLRELDYQDTIKNYEHQKVEAETRYQQTIADLKEEVADNKAKIADLEAQVHTLQRQELATHQKPKDPPIVIGGE